MSNFTDVPYEDIVYFLKSYKQSIPKNQVKTYEKAWKFIEPGMMVPDSIVDYIIAYNLKENIVEPTNYKLTDILYSKD